MYPTVLINVLIAGQPLIEVNARLSQSVTSGTEGFLTNLWVCRSCLSTLNEAQ